MFLYHIITYTGVNSTACMMVFELFIKDNKSESNSRPESRQSGIKVREWIIIYQQQQYEVLHYRKIDSLDSQVMKVGVKKNHQQRK